MDKLKNIPQSQIIAGIILVALLPLLYIWYKSRKEDKSQSKVEQVTLSANQSHYESKLAAYKAKQRMERELMTQRSVIDDRLETFSSDTFENMEENPVVEVVEKVMYEDDKITKAAERKSKPVKQYKSSSASEELRETVSRESEAVSVSSQKELESIQERRRQERLSGWNRNQSGTSASKTYKGVIHGTQELASGQIAQLRLKEEIRLGNLIIPMNTLISGKVRISQARVMIDISTIKLKDGIHPFGMSIYGSDGLPGLPTSLDIKDNAINKEITNEAISQVRRTGVVGSIASSVAGVVTRDKNQKVTLIDAQNIYFKVNSK